MFNFLLTKTPLFFLFQSFWRDEAFTVLLSKRPMLEIIRLTAGDFTPPAYYLHIHIWMILLGSSEVVVRLFSTLWFVILLVGVHRLFKEIFHLSQKEIRWYMALVFINPMILYYAFEGRAYMMLAALVVWSWYLLIKGHTKHLTKLTILGLYTHYFFIFNIVSQSLYLFLKTRSINIRQNKSYTSLMLAGFWFMPWALYLLTHNKTGSGSFWITAPTFKSILYLPAILFTGHESTFGFPSSFTLLPYTILLVAIICIALAFKKKSDPNPLHSVLIGVLWTLVPCVLALLLSFWKPLFLPRYLIFSTVGFLLLLSLLLSEMRSPKVRVILLLLLYVISLHYMSLLLRFRQKEHIRQTITNIKLQAGPKDLIYVDSVLNFHTAQYYFDPKRVYIIGDTYNAIPDYVGKVLISPDRIATYYPSFPQKAFVIHSDMSYDIQSVY